MHRRFIRAQHIGGIELNEEKVAAICVVHAHGSASRKHCADDEPARLRLAGHAFAIMRRPAYAAALLARSGPICGLRRPDVPHASRASLLSRGAA